MHHIFRNHNPVNRKENFNYNVSSVASLEETLLIEKKCVSLLLRLGPKVEL